MRVEEKGIIPTLRSGQVPDVLAGIGSRCFGRDRFPTLFKNLKKEPYFFVSILALLCYDC